MKDNQPILIQTPNLINLGATSKLYHTTESDLVNMIKHANVGFKTHDELDQLSTEPSKRDIVYLPQVINWNDASSSQHYEDNLTKFTDNSRQHLNEVICCKAPSLKCESHSFMRLTV